MSRAALVSALATLTLLAASPATASNLKVCGLVSAKQVTPLRLAPTCRPSPAYPSTFGKTYGANWAPATPNGPVLRVAITVIPNATLQRLASKNLTQGLLGTPHKVRIGDAAYESYTTNGGSELKINTLAGMHYTTLTLDGAKASAKTAFETFARQLIAKLHR